MRLFLLGGGGLLGTEIVSRAHLAGVEAVAPSMAEFDITDPMSSARLAAGEYGSFDWIVNCAAYTAVDLAESEPDAAFAANALAPGYLSKASAALGAAFMQISTDFVFDGLKRTPYAPTDKVNPLSVYGRSKLAGEEAALAGNPQACVIRTAWLFGPNAKCFPRTIIQAWLAGKSLRVVSDQIGSPTYARDLASTIIAACVAKLQPGTYHAAGLDVCSWHELAVRSISAYCEVYELQMPHIDAVSTDMWPTPASRPPYSALDSSDLAKLGLLKMRPLAESLYELVCELGDPQILRLV